MLTKVDVEVDFQRTEVRGKYSAGTSSCGYDGSKDSAVSKHFWTRERKADDDVEFILTAVAIDAGFTREAENHSIERRRR